MPSYDLDIEILREPTDVFARVFAVGLGINDISRTATEADAAELCGNNQFDAPGLGANRNQSRA